MLLLNVEHESQTIVCLFINTNSDCRINFKKFWRSFLDYNVLRKIFKLQETSKQKFGLPISFHSLGFWSTSFRPLFVVVWCRENLSHCKCSGNNVNHDFLLLKKVLKYFNLQINENGRIVESVDELVAAKAACSRHLAFYIVVCNK